MYMCRFIYEEIDFIFEKYLLVSVSGTVCYGRVDQWIRDVCMSHQSD